MNSNRNAVFIAVGFVAAATSVFCQEPIIVDFDAEMLKCDPNINLETVDINGGADFSPNGIVDMDELALLSTILADTEYPFWQEVVDAFLWNLGTLERVETGCEVVHAGMMTLGDEQTWAMLEKGFSDIGITLHKEDYDFSQAPILAYNGDADGDGVDNLTEYNNCDAQRDWYLILALDDAASSPYSGLTVTTKPEGAAIVNVDGTEYTGKIFLEDQSSVTLEAVPAEGYRFNHWEILDEMTSHIVMDKQNPATITADTLLSVTAVMTSKDSEDFLFENDIKLAESVLMIEDPVWSHDGKKIAYFAAPTSHADTGLYVFNIDTYINSLDNGSTEEAAKHEATIFLAHQEVIHHRLEGMTWTPDDGSLVFGSNNLEYAQNGIDVVYLSKCSSTIADQVEAEGQVEHNILGHLDLNPDAAEVGKAGFPTITYTPEGYKLLVTLEHNVSDQWITEGIYVLDVDNVGNITLPGNKVVDAITDGPTLQKFTTLLPSGDDIITVNSWTQTDWDIYMFTGIQDVLDGMAEPISELADSRTYAVNTDEFYSAFPGFTQDGSFVTYGYDKSGLHQTPPYSYADADFNLMVTTLGRIMDGQEGIPILKPGSQFDVKPAPRGTAFLWVNILEDKYELMVSTFRISKYLELISSSIEGEYITATDFELRNGAGMVFRMPAGTRIFNLPKIGEEEKLFTIFTDPNNNPLEQAVTEFENVLPVYGSINPSGVSFSAPENDVVSLEVSYRDQDVTDEENLAIAGTADNVTKSSNVEVVRIISRDTEANKIVGEIEHLSTYGLVVLSDEQQQDSDGDGVPDYMDDFPDDPRYAEDSDEDGLADEWENHYFGNLDQGPHDDYDNDGYTNFEEFQDERLDPTKPDRQLSIDGIGWLLMVMLCSIGYLLLKKENKKETKT